MSNITQVLTKEPHIHVYTSIYIYIYIYIYTRPALLDHVLHDDEDHLSGTAIIYYTYYNVIIGYNVI